MPRRGIPDRWLDYSSYGKTIAGTNFIAFKVPLNQNLCYRLPDAELWTPAMLLNDIPDLGMVIDLTNTSRYYDPEVFKTKNVRFVKIQCEGHGKLPSPRMLDRFYDAVDSFRNATDNSGHLLGVHCTHGLNRTGYFICRYMIDKMGFIPEDAISSFNEARGHPMERLEYVNALKSSSYFHPQTPSPYPSGDTYSILKSQGREMDFGNHTRTKYQRSDEPRLCKPDGDQFTQSFHEAASHGHDMASNHSHSQHISYGSHLSPPKASGSRILYTREIIGNNVQNQELNPNDSCKDDRSTTFHETRVHDYHHSAKTRDLQTYEIGTQLERPVYPNQHQESRDSSSYGSTHFTRTLHPSQEHVTRSQDLDSYSVCTQLERSLYPNQHPNNGAEIQHPNAYSVRTPFDKPLVSYQNPESGTETRDFSLHNDPSSGASYGGSWHSYEGYNDNTRTVRNDCSKNISDLNTWVGYREPTQARRSSSVIYRKPYRARRRN